VKLDRGGRIAPERQRALVQLEPHSLVGAFDDEERSHDAPMLGEGLGSKVQGSIKV
jgi:hypothetical protein